MPAPLELPRPQMQVALGLLRRPLPPARELLPPRQQLVPRLELQRTARRSPRTGPVAPAMAQPIWRALPAAGVRRLDELKPDLRPSPKPEPGSQGRPN